jgi:FtsP/CotA-like multicopper oxidase with cupredoxin domain
VRVNFANAGTHPHTIHFHGIHPANMDGVFELVEPGMAFTYEFDAAPAGLQLYHCHAIPLKRHIHKGLYGTFIIDPAEPVLDPAREMVMVMNGFDTNFDAENEVYAVNSVANAHMHDPIRVTVGRRVRIYLVNLTEFDPINSLHLHAVFFDVFRTGTSLTTAEHTDTVMLCQGERAILETTFRYPGDYMFHAHQSEFAELGWMGLFRAEAPAQTGAAGEAAGG